MLAAAAPAASAKPNLVTTKVSKPPATAVIGGSFRVKETAKNKGSRAGRSDTRFYLSADRKIGLSDLLMLGARSVPALGRDEQSSAPRRPRVMAGVPVGTPRGEYFLLACADDRQAVRESKEGDNCRAARRKVRVTLPLKTPTLVIDAFSDATPELDFATDEQSLTSERRFSCTALPKTNVPSVGAAIASIKKTLATRAGADAYAGFKSSPQYKSAAAAQRGAAAAFLFDQPGAALAALVRAHELEPKEASHLVNAAALATSIGLPSEALALLDGAQRLDDRDRPPMGISRQAVALTNRAHALAALGRWDDATRTADAALAIEPLMAEAQLSAGKAELCKGAIKPAVARIRKARKRQPGKEPPLDDRGGKESSLRNLPLGGTPEQAIALVDFYRAQQGSQRLAELQARNQRRTQIQQRINARKNDRSRNLNRKLLYAVGLASTEPKLKALADKIGPLYTKSQQWWQDKWCEGDSCDDEEWQQIVASCSGDQACVRSKCVPAAKTWHQGWLADNTALYQASNAYFKALSKRMSALASHIKDPDTYQLAMLDIEDQEDTLYFGAQQPAFYWAMWFQRAQDDCAGSDEPPPSTDGTDPAAAQGSGPCPDSIRGINGVLDLGIASFKVNCSEIQVSGSIGEGWIKGFAEVTYDFRAGKTTLVAGSQGEVGAGPLKGSFQSGIYVTASGQGVEDVGWRVGPSATVGAGPVEFSAGGDTVDMSFVGAFPGFGT